MRVGDWKRRGEARCEDAERGPGFAGLRRGKVREVGWVDGRVH